MNTESDKFLGSIVFFLGGAGAGKDTLKDMVKKDLGKKCVDPVSFLLSDLDAEGRSCRPLRNPEKGGESNRVWINEEIFNDLEAAGLVRSRAKINAGGYNSGSNQGYDYIYLDRFDKDGEHKNIWNKISKIHENNINPAFQENRLDSLSITEVIENDVIKEGKTFILDGHAVTWFPSFYEKIKNQFPNLPIQTFGLVGLREETSVKRQLGRSSEPTTEEISIAQTKANDAVEQGDFIVKNARKFNIYKMTAISLIAASTNSEVRNNFVKNRANWVEEIIYLDTQKQNVQNLLGESVGIEAAQNYVDRLTTLSNDITAVKEMGLYDERRELDIEEVREKFDAPTDSQKFINEVEAKHAQIAYFRSQSVYNAGYLNNGKLAWFEAFANTEMSLKYTDQILSIVYGWDLKDSGSQWSKSEKLEEYKAKIKGKTLAQILNDPEIDMHYKLQIGEAVRQKMFKLKEIAERERNNSELKINLS